MPGIKLTVVPAGGVLEDIAIGFANPPIMFVPRTISIVAGAGQTAVAGAGVAKVNPLGEATVKVATDEVVELHPCFIMQRYLFPLIGIVTAVSVNDGVVAAGTTSFQVDPPFVLTCQVYSRLAPLIGEVAATVKVALVAGLTVISNGCVVIEAAGGRSNAAV